MGVARIISAIFLAAGVAAAGWFVSEALVKSRVPERNVTVQGLSERQVLANLGFWPLRFVVSGASLADARAELEKSEQAVRLFLGDKGFGGVDIQVQNVTVEDRFAEYNAGTTPNESRFVLTEDILVTSREVDALAMAARDTIDLLRSGVVLSSDAYSAGPSFILTSINDLKSEMLTEATGHARETAQQFAKDSGTKVGNIKSANQGVFEILPALVIPNDRPEKQINKTVRVVSTITYFLVD